MDWDPISWLKSALGDVTGPLGKIEKWTLKQIAKAAALVENDVHKLSDYVDAHVGGIENTISHLAGQINNLAAGVGGDVAGAFDATRHEIASLIDDALHPIKSEDDALKRDVPGWAKDAEHYADDALKAFERDVLDPALKEIRTAIHAAESDAEHAWHVWYKDIWAPALHDLREAEHAAHQAIYFIDHSALDAIHIVDECWDWLEWMAKNPAKALEELPAKAFAELGSGKLSAAATEVTSGWSDLVTELEKKFSND
jgi:prophage DNA circulation protein